MSEAVSTVMVQRRNRRYELPEEGILYPNMITLPPQTAPRNTIFAFGNSLGIVMPASYNRRRLLDRIADVLQEFGYERTSPNVYSRDEPISVKYEDALEPVEEIALPEIIPYSVFNTRNALIEFIRDHNLNTRISSNTNRLKRDLRVFLSEQGYFIDSEGNFVREGGVIIPGGYELPDLINTEQYLQLLNSANPITIAHPDLVKLNLPFKQLLSTLQYRRWPTLQNFAEDVGAQLEIAPNVMYLVALLAHLPKESFTVVKSVLFQLGDTTNYRNKKEHIKAIYSYIRPKLNLIPRHYEERTEFMGNATTKMTLMQAIAGGYSFGPEQYKTEINELLNYDNLRTSQYNSLVDLIQRYPQMIVEMRRYYSTGNTFASRLIHLYYENKPNILQELYAFAVNYPLIIEETQEERERRMQLEALPQSYLGTLYRIYELRNINDILDTERHPLELYLIAIAQVQVAQLQELVQGFGMIIPQHLITREIRSYVLHWMPDYKNILTREPGTPDIAEVLTEQPESARELIRLLQPYTDYEIINFFGYISGFQTRNALIANIYDIIDDESFFLINNINPQRAVNTETIMLTELDDLFSPYLVFGSPLSYRVHELDEFIQAWSDGIFKSITGDGNYRVAQVSKLQSLLPLMVKMNGEIASSVDRLLTLVKSGILSTLRRNQEIDRLIREVRTAPGEIKKLLMNIFYQLFYMGMYMRRWEGPGHSYPTNSAMTLGGNNPEPIAILAIGQLSDMLSQLHSSNEEIYDYVMNLPEIEYNAAADNMSISRKSVFALVNKVARGDYCIRIASKKFIIAGHYYLGVIFGEVIPDFSPYDVESIS